MDTGLFGRACQRLERQVLQKGWRPELIIGIAEGGAVVARNIFPGRPHATAHCHRSGTGHKKRASTLMRLIRRCPLWMRDLMRMAEARLLSRRREHAVTEPVLSPEACEAISKAVFILIVDDACDSGCTLRAVYDKVMSLCQERVIVKTAVLTVTTDNPVISPDYALYRNKTLIRFPWSMDMPHKN